MTTLSGFTRPSDPISAVDIATQISTALGKTVTCIVTPTDVEVTGTISGGDSTAIQTAITAYFYSFFQYGAPLVDNPDMSASRHDKGITEHAAYQGDLASAAIGSAKTANRTYINGVAKNGTPVTGDLVEWIETANTSGGVAVFNMTADRTSGGTAICSTVYSDSIQTNFIDSSGVYAQGSPTITSNKSVSVPFTKQAFSGVTLLSTNILGSVAMNTIPDGVAVKFRAVGLAT